MLFRLAGLSWSAPFVLPRYSCVTIRVAFVACRFLVSSDLCCLLRDGLVLSVRSRCPFALCCRAHPRVNISLHILSKFHGGCRFPLAGLVHVIHVLINLARATVVTHRFCPLTNLVKNFVVRSSLHSLFVLHLLPPSFSNPTIHLYSFLDRRSLTYKWGMGAGVVKGVEIAEGSHSLDKTVPVSVGVERTRFGFLDPGLTLLGLAPAVTYLPFLRSALHAVFLFEFVP